MESFTRLVHGFGHFRESYFLKEADFFAGLARAQDPRVLVIACSDSRVDPALLMHCKPGEIFVVRNVAALVPPPALAQGADAVMAAVEYAVKHLEVDDIVVLGHGSCGGIHALLTPKVVEMDEHIGPWVSIAAPAVARTETVGEAETEKTLHHRVEEGAVLLSVENLLAYPWIEERVKAGTLRIHAWYYELVEGRLWAWDGAREAFSLLEAVPRG